MDLKALQSGFQKKESRQKSLAAEKKGLPELDEKNYSYCLCFFHPRAAPPSRGDCTATKSKAWRCCIFWRSLKQSARSAILAHRKLRVFFRINIPNIADVAECDCGRIRFLHKVNGWFLGYSNATQQGAGGSNHKISTFIHNKVPV